MMDVKEEHETYLADFAQLNSDSAANGQSPWASLRKEALSHFTEQGFPTPTDEDWRFTNLATLIKVPFKLAGGNRGRLNADSLRELLRGTEDGQRLVFVNGHYDQDLSHTDPRNVRPLSAFLDHHPEWVNAHLTRYAKLKDSPFTALNTAFLRDGAFVYLAAGQVVEKPIHLVYLSTTGGEPTVSHPRALVVAEANSQATIVETFIGPEHDVYFTNAVTEIVLAENAILDHYKVQRESGEAFHIATLQVHQNRSSNFASHAITFGGGLVRNDVNAVLDAEGCECTLNGLSMGAERQLIDNHTRIDHAKPRCASHELYKSILDGQARGVFNGKIYVHQDAQKTDAKQTNQTLLLSPDAIMDTKPQLEIFADDVKCTHGATVGQLRREAIFYLRSRGIGHEEARKLLTFAFANDIVERIKVRAVRAQLEEVLLASQGLPRDVEVDETS